MPEKIILQPGKICRSVASEVLMGHIFVIQDISPGQPWLFSHLTANQAYLAKSGIVMAPFNPWACQTVPDHSYCGSAPVKKALLPEALLNNWRGIGSSLAAGKDILLLVHSANPVFYENLGANFAQLIDMAGHKFSFLAIVGRPALSFETRFRKTVPPFADSWIEAVSKAYQRLPALFAHMRGLFGESSLAFLHNCQTSAASVADAGLADRVYAFPGLSNPGPLARFPAYPLFLRSHDARILARSLQIRYNAWPALDESACMAALQALDREWPEDYSAPLEARASFVANCALEELGQLTGIDPGQLAPPERFAETPAADRPLDRNRAAAFAAALCAEDRKALFRRLDQDSRFLTDDQKILREALSPGFAYLGPLREKPALTVLTMTYNHEKYIADCMESVLAQKTDFAVRHIVLDHHSSDGTADIVAKYARDYPSIQAVLLSQRAAAENVLGLFLRCRSQYAALCDGDDFFTDPAKLQKQANFLENNPDCALCFHPVAAVFEDGRPSTIFPPLSSLPRRSKREFYLADLTSRNFIQTNSVVYRWRFQNGLPDWFRPDLCPGDWYWHMLHAETGRIGFIPEIMSVYRRHSGALYMDAFSSSTANLRRKRGLAELDAYAAYDDHFKGRYFRSFAKSADHVFMDFLGISIDDGDDSLINAAVDRYPRFADHFLRGLEDMRKSGGELILQRRTKN